jgi:hypothetical protein
MSKQIKKTQNVEESFPIEVTGKFVTVSKSSHLLYEAFEVEIYKGIVVSCKTLSRAPDLSQISIGACQRNLWSSMDQKRVVDETK